MSTATELQPNKAEKDIEVLFIRVPSELKQRIKAASDQRGHRDGEPKRRGNINRMLVELLDETYPKDGVFEDGSEDQERQADES